MLLIGRLWGMISLIFLTSVGAIKARALGSSPRRLTNIPVNSSNVREWVELALQEDKRVNDKKMLTIVCREHFEDEVMVVFNRLGIKGYTVMWAGGSGETGAVSGKHGWRDRNMIFLVALDDTQMATLVTAMKELHARLVQENRGHEVPLKAFLQPCEVVL